MQRFFFDVRDGHEIAKDDEGLLLASVEAAISEAKRSLGDITKEVLRDTSYTGTVSIEIRTEQQMIGTVGLIYSVQMKSSALT